MTLPLIDKSVCWPLLGAGLLAFVVVHPYVAYVLWALTVVVLFQELVLMAALPFMALWNLLVRK